MSNDAPKQWHAYQHSGLVPQEECWSVECDGQLICDLWRLSECTHDAHPFDDDEANARLIAAAPELLAACKKAAEFLDSMDLNCFGHSIKQPSGPTPWEALREAIKQAEATS